MQCLPRHFELGLGFLWVTIKDRIPIDFSFVGCMGCKGWRGLCGLCGSGGSGGRVGSGG